VGDEFVGVSIVFRRILMRF